MLVVHAYLSLLLHAHLIWVGVLLCYNCGPVCEGTVAVLHRCMFVGRVGAPVDCAVCLFVRKSCVDFVCYVQRRYPWKLVSR
jgi:hypothetical protein